MKKMMLLAIAAGTFAFTSCSKDDDGGGSSGCVTCSMSMEGMEMSSEYCDNGDGTYTQTTEGVETTLEIPEGVTFDDIIAAAESAGMTCN